jgi:hypothetical protein
MGLAFRAIRVRDCPARQGRRGPVGSNLATAIRTGVVFVFAWAIAIGLGSTAKYPFLTGAR